MINFVKNHFDRASTKIKILLPGLALACLVAMSAQFVAEHSQAPAMLMALLFGMAISFVYETDTSVRPGIEFTAHSILKFGIVLLGARISVEFVLALGWQSICLIVFALVATLLFGLIVGRLLGLSRNIAILTAGAVSICGASAALAISSVLPKNSDSEKQLFVTIIGVTGLSTVAMILYPALLAQFEVSETIAGQIIGATVHDVAQVVGAGFSISDTAGDKATLVKLMRVSLLAPTVIVIALIIRRQHKIDDHSLKRPPIIPIFVLGFIFLAGLNSFGLVPEAWKAPYPYALNQRC